MCTSKLSSYWNKIQRWRNRIVAIFAIAFLLLAFLSYPADQLDFFAPPIEATYIFDIPGRVFLVFTNGTSGFYNITVGRGTVTLSGKGGLSAGNPLTMTVTLELNPIIRQPSKAFVAPYDAYYFPIERDAQGFPRFAHINLTRTDQYAWFGQGRVEFFAQGTMIIYVALDNQVVPSLPELQIESESVTAASRTNSLLVSLTWAILFFAVLELRTEQN